MRKALVGKTEASKLDDLAKRNFDGALLQWISGIVKVDFEAKADFVELLLQHSVQISCPLKSMPT